MLVPLGSGTYFGSISPTKSHRQTEPTQSCNATNWKISSFDGINPVLGIESIGGGNGFEHRLLTAEVVGVDNPFGGQNNSPQNITFYGLPGRRSWSLLRT